MIMMGPVKSPLSNGLLARFPLLLLLRKYTCHNFFPFVSSTFTPMPSYLFNLQAAPLESCIRLILTTRSFICGKLCCMLRVCAKSSGKPWTSDLTVWWVFAVRFSLTSEIAKTTRNHKMQMTGRFHMEIQICGKNPLVCFALL